MLVFSCTGRGVALYNAADVEAAMLDDVLARQVCRSG
jgi:small ligand-binding sensory domain FIST